MVLISAGTRAADPVLAGPPAPRVVNVTADSAPGWTPSVEQETAARKAALDYLGAMDAGRLNEAYALLAPGEQTQDPLASFSARVAAFNARAGTVIERRIIYLTWTKDPAQGPDLGVYAAFDLVSRFANIDRYCGYLVLRQPPSGGPFRVGREEDVFIDNATAGKMTASELEATWAKLTANCPNYAAGQPAAVVAPPPPLPEQPNTTIGYPTVAAALADLHSRPGIVFTSKDGWTVASDQASRTLWSFPPAGNPAYPAAVKRQIVPMDGGYGIQMKVLCQASKAACDDLVRSFEQLNDQMRAALHGGGR